ncbi:hypothetical protein [Chryseobacterium nematophagum]|uniref:hypothetical protein n=1 Tax=Chryseobacterium nematophagum TaxID=2305228 RepID=UPI001604D822|nr:hypothetical protein [Chryseobacterium nematophagum]
MQIKNLKVEELNVLDIKNVEGGAWYVDVFQTIGKSIFSGFGKATYNYAYNNYGYYFPW